MRRSSSGQDMNNFLGLDSLMDIVTNVMGALFFVVVFAALSSFEARGKVTTPIASTGSTKGIVFECRSNTILFPDFDGLHDQIDKKVKEMKTQDVLKLVDLLREAKIGNDFYTFVPKIIFRGNYIYLSMPFVPVSGSQGEDTRAIQPNNSKYQTKLRELDSKKNHIYFLVRADSFEIFQEARRIAVKNGFQVGWEPMPTDSPISFGTGKGPANIDQTF